MSIIVLRDPIVRINNVDLSTHCSSAVVEDAADEVDLTGFTEGSREYGLGLQDAGIILEALQDFSADEVDATLWPLYSGNVTFQVVVRPTAGPISATNPEYRMTSRLIEYPPVGGGVGDAAATTLEFRPYRHGITRHTSLDPYAGIDGDGDPFFDEDGVFVDVVGIDGDGDPYIDLAGAGVGPTTMFLDGDEDIAVTP